MKELVFDDVYRSGLIALRLVQAHPSIPHDCYWVIRIIILYSFFFIGFVNLMYNLWYDYTEGLDLATICSHAIMATVFCVATFQWLIAVCFRKQVGSLMADMRKDYDAYKTLTERDRGIVYDYAMKGGFAMRVWTYTVIANGLMYPLGAIGNTFFSYCMSVGRIYHLFDVVYPEPVQSQINNPLMFLFVNCISSFYITFSITIYIAVVSLGPIFMLHACGQLALIKARVERLFVEDDYTPAGAEAYLKDMVAHLQYIYDFVERIKEALTFMYEMALKISVICLSLAAFLIIKTKQQGKFRLEFLTFFSSGCVYCFVPCFFGDLLMQMGEEIRQAVYGCGWEYEMHRPARLTILNVLSRAIRPTAVSSIFRTVSLDAFGDVVRDAYSLFNLLMAAMD